MTDYRAAYEAWLRAPRLSDEERAELRGIEGDEEEIRQRFSGQTTFGTGGLREKMRQSTLRRAAFDRDKQGGAAK